MMFQQSVPPNAYQARSQYIPPMNIVDPNVNQQQMMHQFNQQQLAAQQMYYPVQQPPNQQQQQPMYGQENVGHRNRNRRRGHNKKNKADKKENTKDKEDEQAVKTKKANKEKLEVSDKEGAYPVFFPTKDGLVPRFVNLTGKNLMESIADKYSTDPTDSTNTSSEKIDKTSENSSNRSRISYFEDSHPSSSEDNRSRRMGRPWPYIDLKRYSKGKTAKSQKKPILVVTSKKDELKKTSETDSSKKGSVTRFKQDIESITNLHQQVVV